MMRTAVDHRRPAKEAHQANPPICRPLDLPSDATDRAIAVSVAKDPDEDWSDAEEILKSEKPRGNHSGTLIENPIRGEPPTRTARQTGITSRDEVFADHSGCRSEAEIHQRTQPVAMTVDQIRINQRRQPFKSGLITDGWISTHKHLLVREPAALIEPPDITSEPQG